MKSFNHKPCSLFINSNTSRVLIALCALFVSAQSASHDGHDHSSSLTHNHDDGCTCPNCC